MHENHFINKAVRKASSFERYSIRAKKDTCLQDDVEDFIAKHGGSIPRLVDKLINNDFVLARFTDPTYPD